MSFEIIGAGVAGLCVATELVKRGASVRLFDREAAPGDHACSWWAGGMLAPWCERESAEEPVLTLGREAADWWDLHAGGVSRRGTLVLALGRDKRELDRFARRTSAFETLDRAGVDALEPDLAGRFERGLFFAEEAHLTPRDALAALSKALADKGVPVETDASVPADSVQRIDCRGLSARDALADLRGVKGEMLVIRCPDVTLTRPVRLLHPRIPLYIVPRGNGVYMLGATMVESTERERITARALLEMLSAAYALHPAFAEAEVLEIGVDARPAFPDNLPRITTFPKGEGAGRSGGTVYVNGLYRHGFLLAPAMARITAEYLLEGKSVEIAA